MTVQELINELNKIEDKSLPVGFDAEDRGTHDIDEVVIDEMYQQKKEKFYTNYVKERAVILSHF